MNNVTLSELEEEVNKLNYSLQLVEQLLPKICESSMPLSITGVSPRTIFHWRKTGLIDTITLNGEERTWVRINLIEYVWIKIIQVMRDFGIPMETIKKTKKMLFVNALQLIIDDKEKYGDLLKAESNMSTSKLESRKKIIDLTSQLIDQSPKEFEIFSTLIGSIIIGLLLQNDKGSIIITRKQNQYEVSYFSFKTMDDYQKIIYPLLDLPHIQIPIRKLIEDFLDNPKSEKFVDSFELLNLKEKKVIDAMRNKDFKEIVIKLNNKKELIIELEKDGDLMDQKAKEVRKILGLNDYSEITIKYRNDKHLYVKNKTRL